MSHNNRLVWKQTKIGILTFFKSMFSCLFGLKSSLKFEFLKRQKKIDISTFFSNPFFDAYSSSKFDSNLNLKKNFCLVYLPFFESKILCLFVLELLLTFGLLWKKRLSMVNINENCQYDKRLKQRSKMGEKYALWLYIMMMKMQLFESCLHCYAIQGDWLRPATTIGRPWFVVMSMIVVLL